MIDSQVYPFDRGVRRVHTVLGKMGNACEYITAETAYPADIFCPQFGQNTASAANSLPHLVQYRPFVLDKPVCGEQDFAKGAGFDGFLV